MSLAIDYFKFTSTAIALIASMDSYAATESVSLARILDDLYRTHPVARSARAGVEAASGGVLKSQSVFDPVLRGFGKRDWQELYPSASFEVGIRQRTPWIGTELEVFHAYGQGTFGPYRLDEKTLSQGELGFRLVQPLLKGALIDSGRAQLQSSAFDRDIQIQHELATKLNLSAEATRAYLNWAASLEKERIRESVLQFAQQRQAGMEARSKRGDLAEMQLVDNRRLIAERRAKWIAARQERVAAYLKLTTYISQNGESLDDLDREPEQNLASMIDLVKEEIPNQTTASMRPEIRQADLEISRIELELKLMRSSLKI
jgi:outer membrane protein TolC